ncbi:MAG: EAL domain-containing protein [Burkholderiales bacterium]|nr:EAL domain-containing protein [Burkholderiales bacterium]
MPGTPTEPQPHNLSKALLDLCKRLERAWTVEDILSAYAPVAAEILGYRQIWLAIFNIPNNTTDVLSFFSDQKEADFRQIIPVTGIPIQGDRMLEEVMEGDHIVVVDDARTDPRTNKDIVAVVQNRTIINIPLILAQQKLGAMGMGTRGDEEGVRPPLNWQLDFMQAMAGHVAVALDRVEFMRARQQAEEALQASIEFSNSLIEAMQDGFIVLDLTGKQIDANRAFCRMCGFSREELVAGELGFPYWPQDHYEQTKAAFKTIVDGCFDELELSFVKKNGERFPVYLNPSAVKNAQGDIINYIATIKDISERKAAENQIKYQASHDELTGLGNRRAFEQMLDELFEQTRHNGSKHVLAYLDLDEFKVINDTCGHTVGDELLRQVARQFNSCLRSDDGLYRIGGDEFGMVLRDQNLEQALLIAERLQRHLANFRFQWQERSFAVGVSIGLVVVNKDSESVGALLQSVDSACYVAKESGRGRIHVYANDDPALAQRYGVMEWVSRIENALSNDLFSLYAQTIFNLEDDTDKGIHCEVLLRMSDEHGGIILPGSFMPAVERYHLAARVDKWVVSHAFDWIAQHQSHIDLCAINLSGQSLSDPQFLNFIQSKLQQANIPCKKVCFEITETAAISQIQVAQKFIHTLSDMGCQFSLDDFGSGLSSFAYLRTLNVDILKIDGQFVRDIETNPINLAMVKSIHEIAHLMGKRTVAEFVENTAILEKLRAIGIDYGQGYGLGRPMPIHQLLNHYATLPDTNAA